MAIAWWRLASAGPTAIQLRALPPRPWTMRRGLPSPPKSTKWTGPSMSTTLCRIASILRLGFRARGDDGARHPVQDLDHGADRPAPVLVQAVERGERGEETDHVLGLFEGAAGTKPVLGSQPLGQVAVLVGRVELGGAGQATEESWVSRPVLARLANLCAQLFAAAHGPGAALWPAPALGGQGLEEPRVRAEVVVHAQ